MGSLVALLAWWGFTAAPSSVQLKQQGVCWVAGHQKLTGKEFERIDALHINWISQTPFGWQARPGGTEIRTNTSGEKIWWGESDEGLAETTRMAHALNIKTLLKPHLWVSKSWPGDVAMGSDADWAKWFSAYEEFILHYAVLAEKHRVDLFCIGTELQQTISHEKEWRSIIKKIRSVYHGPLTYAANFHQEFERIAFWDELDFIGVQAYFPLSPHKDPPVNELVEGWRTPLASIEKIHLRFGKPVLFTEIGYRSTHDAAIEPWRWPNERDASEVCNEVQASCYTAFFQAVWNKKWMAGAYFWKWYPHGGSGLKESDFTPQEKQAERVIRENFSK